jgi:phosphatidylglycerophosphatase A
MGGGTKETGIRRAAILFIAEGAYSGRFPFAPGTAGTIAAIPLYLVMMQLSPAVYLSICGVIVGLGLWAAGQAETLLGKKDASSIVIDEIAGFLLSMFLVPPAWGYIVAGFLLFRVFDIIKPYPLRQLQDLHGGLGVMIDDIGAGIYTNAVLQIINAFLL